MSATADRPAVAARPARARAADLELLGEVSGSGYRDGAALVRRGDGQMVQLGPLMYGLLEEIDGRREDAALAAAMSARLGREVGEEHVARLAEKLAAQGLLSGTEHNAPPRLNPLLALRFKVLVTDPGITRRITAPFVNLFRPWLVVPVVAAFAAVCWFVLIHKGVASATAQAFHSPELLLLILALGIASAAFHEIGHASACRYGGGRPGGMGAGIYIVWPAFYTDVTDAYRLPRGARLRTDLGGLYFNAVIAVVTLGVWLAVRVDALLLLVGLQMLEMVKNLSPVIRSDGYHVLSDASGVPDLYAHIGPTLRRLLPWRRREPSALTGRAGLLVTAWVLIIVPVLAAMSLSAILLMPRLATSTWDSASHIASAIPHQSLLPLLASLVRILALALPVVGTVLMVGRLGRRTATRALAWSAGRTERRVALAVAAAALAGLLAWAWWPSGQYQPVRATDRGTLQSVGTLVSAQAGAVPAAAPAPAQAAAPAAAPVRLSAGTHLAVAMIPTGGATKQRPAVFVIRGGHGQKPAIVVSPKAPSTTSVPTMSSPAVTPSAPASAPTAPAPVTAFPFTLPAKPGPNDSQALAVNREDGGVKYDVVYSLVTVESGQPVDETNGAYAFANCRSCTTVAVSFQLVLVVGQTQAIAPINVAEALNGNCPTCMTTAIADQIVVTLSAAPSQELVRRLTSELTQLDAISKLGAGGTPAAVAKQVVAVQNEIEQELARSGLTPQATAEATATPTPGPTSTASPSATATTTPDPTATGTPTPTPSPSASPSATASATPTPTATATP